MDMLRDSAASACFLGIVFSVMGGALPSDKLARQVNIIFSLILVIVLVTPFADADFSLETAFPDAAEIPDNSYIFESRLMDNVSLNISEELGKILAEKGIYPLKITVDINNSGDGSILINGAEIILGSPRGISEARRLAAEALGEDESKIIVKTEDGGNDLD